MTDKTLETLKALRDNQEILRVFISALENDGAKFWTYSEKTGAFSLLKALFQDNRLDDAIKRLLRQ